MQDTDSNNFNVNLENYQGPLDILLDLAKAQKVDLENISITLLADQFHDYITNKKDTLKTLAFNNPKDESSMTFLNTKSLAKNNKNISTSNSIKEHFQEINEKSEVHWLWKWFLTLAIVSLLLEILILKFFKS